MVHHVDVWWLLFGVQSVDEVRNLVGRDWLGHEPLKNPSRQGTHISFTGFLNTRMYAPRRRRRPLRLRRRLPPQYGTPDVSHLVTGLRKTPHLKHPEVRHGDREILSRLPRATLTLHLHHIFPHPSFHTFPTFRQRPSTMQKQ